jgi:hypothetical protein
MSRIPQISKRSLRASCLRGRLKQLGWREFIAIPEHTVNQDGRLLHRPVITFWYRGEGDLTIEALQKNQRLQTT